MPGLSSGALNAELVGAARDVDVEQRRNARVVRADIFGPQLRAEPDPNANVPVVLSLGGAPCRQ